MTTRDGNTAVILFFLQRVSGALLAILLGVHLATIIYAVQGGLTVEEIVDRVRGNEYWIIFYGLFVFVAIVHALIGIRKIVSELFSFKQHWVDLFVGAYTTAAMILGYLALEALW